MDEKDSLWDLLGKAKKPAVSPFFARNVLRAIRTAEKRGGFAWLFRGWRAAALGGIAVILLALNLTQFVNKTESRQQLELASNQDYDVITHLDELLASEENSIWLDSSSD